MAIKHWIGTIAYNGDLENTNNYNDFLLPINGDTIYVSSTNGMIDAYPSSGTATGSWHFLDGGLGVNCTINGSCVFCGESTANAGTINLTDQTCVFSGSNSINTGTINATNTVAMTNANVIFSGPISIQQGTIVINGATDITNVEFSFNGTSTEDAAGNAGNINGNCLFSGNYSFNFIGEIYGNCHFTGDHSFNFDVINGNCIFESNSSGNLWGAITGNAKFNYPIVETGTVSGNVEFIGYDQIQTNPQGPPVSITYTNCHFVYTDVDFATDLSNYVFAGTNTWTFNGTATNNCGAMPLNAGTVYFYDQSSNASEGEEAFYFYDNSVNLPELSFLIGANFYDNSINYGYPQYANFSGSSRNDGTILYNSAFTNTSYNNGTCGTTATNTASFSGSSHNELFVSGIATFTQTAYNNGTTTTAYFYNNSYMNNGSATTAFFHDSSYMNDGYVDTANLYDNSVTNGGTIITLNDYRTGPIFPLFPNRSPLTLSGVLYERTFSFPIYRHYYWNKSNTYDRRRYGNPSNNN